MRTHRKYYFPLTVNLIEHDDYGYLDCNDEGSEYDGHTALNYQDDIEARFASYTEGDEDMATYFRDTPLKVKIESMKWGFESVNNSLWGVVDVALNSEITQEEDEEIKDYITGQNSDGLGEGFEQQDISVDEGILNVHFWKWSDDYQIYSEEEFIDQFESQGMGAM